jgi:hypothetical protein
MQKYNAPSSGKRERFGAASEWFSVDLVCYAYFLAQAAPTAKQSSITIIFGK